MALFCVLQNRGLQLQLVNDAVNDGYLWDDLFTWEYGCKISCNTNKSVSVRVCSISS